MQNQLLAGGVVNPEITNPLLGDLGKKTGTEFFQSFIPGLITLAIGIGSIIFFFMLVAGAIQWISSGGDKQAVENARGRVSSAMIGLVILFAVFAIIKLIEIFFGITILTLDIGKIIIQ